MSGGDIARPENPAPVDSPDVYKACRSFVLAYALPALAPANVVQGWNNRASLPQGTNDYAVISILGDKQHGTTVETYGWDRGAPENTGFLGAVGLIELTVQVDFCADTDVARLRARRLAVATRSSMGVQFFNDRGLSALYADDARDLSAVGDAKQFVRRWMTTLHLSVNDGIRAEFEAFDRVALARLEDVDSHHNPREE